MQQSIRNAGAQQIAELMPEIRWPKKCFIISPKLLIYVRSPTARMIKWEIISLSTFAYIYIQDYRSRKMYFIEAIEA